MDIDKIIEESISSTITWPVKMTIKILGFKWVIKITQADFLSAFPQINDVIKSVVAQTKTRVKKTTV